MSAVLPQLAEPKTSVITNGRKCITAVYTDGTEVVDEFDVINDTLVLRKRRTKTALGAYSDWAIEVGSEARARNVDRELILEVSGSPELIRQDSAAAYVFRIRNLPYPRDVYSVTVERTEGSADAVKAAGEIVVRTSNKKYYKRIDIPDMTRARVPLEQSHVSYEVKHNTLIIEYKKHLAILAAENEARKERSALPAKRVDEKSQNCPQQ